MRFGGIGCSREVGMKKQGALSKAGVILMWCHNCESPICVETGLSFRPDVLRRSTIVLQGLPWAEGFAAAVTAISCYCEVLAVRYI